MFASIVLTERNSSIEETHDTITVMFGKLLFMWYLEDTYLNSCINSESRCLYDPTTILMKTSNTDLVRYFGPYCKHYTQPLYLSAAYQANSTPVCWGHLCVH